MKRKQPYYVDRCEAALLSGFRCPNEAADGGLCFEHGGTGPMDGAERRGEALKVKYLMKVCEATLREVREASR